VPFVDVNISDINLDPNVIQSCYDRGCELYPQHKLEDFERPQIRDQLLHDGENMMIYFSEDGAHNLEEVQHQPIYIDASGPQFMGNFTYDTVEHGILKSINFNFCRISQ